MQNFRALKKKTVGGSLMDVDKARYNKDNLDRDYRQDQRSRSDRSLNNSAMSDRRITSNGSVNSNPSTERRVMSNGSMGAGTPSPNERLRQPRSAPSQDASRYRHRHDVQEPEPAPSTSQYDLVWHRGDLALQFTLNSKQQIVIRQIEHNLPKETTAGLSNASPGDVLVALNWDDVTKLTPADIQNRLNQAELPMTLTFLSTSPPSAGRSNRAPSLTRMPPLGQGEFDAIWSNGKLGVVIACDPTGKPFVRGFAKDASTDPGVASIRPLDQLLFVNDISVLEIGYDQAMMALRQAQKPVLLRFYRPRPAPTQNERPQPSQQVQQNQQMQQAQASQPNRQRRGTSQSSGPTNYTIVWREGPLGMVLKKNNANDIYIKELKEKGLALAHKSQLAEGDILLTITGVPTKPLGLTGTVDFLKTVQKPVELVFQHPPVPMIEDQRARQSTMVVLPLPSEELSNNSFISDGVAAKYLNKPTKSNDETPSAPVSSTASYDLIWHRGKLAISLRYASTNQTVIRKITPTEDQTTANLNSAQVGDVLVAINWEDVTSTPYEDVVARLKERDFPLTLSFKRGLPPRNEPPALPKGAYEVIWNEGKLGVKIHCDPEGRAMVRERTEEVADPELAKIQAGDELVAVNDLRVKSIGYAEALVSMKKPKPIKLRFQRKQRSVSAAPPPAPHDIPEPSEVHLDSLPPSSNSPRQSLALSKSLTIAAEDLMYSVDWASGSLGITLRMNDEFEIYIAQLAGKGLSLDCPDMKVGDLLIGVMGVPTTPLGLAGTVDFLKCIQKPAVLTFLRKAKPYIATHSDVPQSTVSSVINSPAIENHQVISNSDENVAPPLTPPTAPLVPLESPKLDLNSPKYSTGDASNPWTTSHDSNHHIPVSPSSHVEVSLRASSDASGAVSSSKPLQPMTPPISPQAPNAAILSPVQNVSIGPIVDVSISSSNLQRAEPQTPPGTPPPTSFVISRPPVKKVPQLPVESKPIESNKPIADLSAASFVISRPPLQSVESPSSVSSEPIQSPIVTGKNPQTPPGTPPNVSIVISRPLPNRNNPPSQLRVDPITPPGTPPPLTGDQWSDEYSQPTSLPVEPPIVQDIKYTEATTSHSGISRFNLPASDSYPDYDDERVGSIADLPDYRGTEDGSFSLMHSMHSVAAPYPNSEETPWHQLGRDGSIADLPDFRSGEQIGIQQPNMYRPDKVLTQDWDFGPSTRVPKKQKWPQSSQQVSVDEGVNSMSTKIAPGDQSMPSNLDGDISRGSKTPTNQTPTASASMFTLNHGGVDQSPRVSNESLNDDDEYGPNPSFDSSAEFLSARSLADNPVDNPPDFTSYSLPMGKASNSPKRLALDTISLDDGEVDIDDDDDSIQEDYSTIAPEDVPVLLSMSSRSMSSASIPPTPPPVPAPLPENEETVPQTLFSVLWRGGPLGLAIKRNRKDEISVKALTGGGLAGMSDIIQPGDVLVQCGTKIVQYLNLSETSKVLKEANTPISLVFLRRGGPNQSDPPLSTGSVRGSASSVPTLDPSTNSYDNSRMIPNSTSGATLDGTFMSDSELTMTSRGSVLMPKRLPSNKHSTVYSIVWEGGPLGIAVTKNSDDENCVMRLTGDGLAAQSTIIQVGDVLVAAGDVQVAKLSLTAAMQVIQLARKPTFLVFRRPGQDEDV